MRVGRVPVVRRAVHGHENDAKNGDDHAGDGERMRNVAGRDGEQYGHDDTACRDGSHDGHEPGCQSPVEGHKPNGTDNTARDSPPDASRRKVRPHD